MMCKHLRGLIEQQCDREDTEGRAPSKYFAHEFVLSMMGSHRRLRSVYM